MNRGFGVRPQAGSATMWECYAIDTNEAVLSNVTNQEAWREVDKRLREATSRQENVTDWIWKQRCNQQ